MKKGCIFIIIDRKADRNLSIALKDTAGEWHSQPEPLEGDPLLSEIRDFLGVIDAWWLARWPIYESDETQSTTSVTVWRHPSLFIAPCPCWPGPVKLSMICRKAGAHERMEDLKQAVTHLWAVASSPWSAQSSLRALMMPPHHGWEAQEHPNCSGKGQREEEQLPSAQIGLESCQYGFHSPEEEILDSKNF